MSSSAETDRVIIPAANDGGNYNAIRVVIIYSTAAATAAVAPL